MKYNPEKKYRTSTRLKNFNYSSNGYYFMTICTQNRECILGEIENGKIKLNDIGNIVESTWDDLPNHNNIRLDSFIMMPNYIHGIIHIVGAGSKPALNHANTRADLESAPTRSLSEIVRQFKSFSTRRINKKQNVIGISIWQRNYYEHIIYNDKELEKIRKYICDNPYKWNEDENNPNNLN